MPALWKCSTGFIVVLSIAVQIEAVTVNPLCPTNKIAPHRRIRRFKNPQPRTFHAYYDLLRPAGSYDAPSSLQEEPQEDDPADCGEIEDYDENDVSSVSSQSSRRQGHNYNNKYGHSPQNFHNFYGILTRPTIPPKRPTRPPSGGYFGNNAYNPPKPLKPTAHLKPVREDGQEPHMTYRPGIVGGPSGHIIGLPQVKPTRHYETTTHIKHNVNRIHDTTTQTNKRNPQRNRPPGVIGSFIDLLF